MLLRHTEGRISRFGLLLTLAIILAVIAFGVFKRKGARKPPPIPEEATGSLYAPSAGVQVFSRLN